MHYHVPKPFYRKSRDTWYVEVDGRQINSSISVFRPRVRKTFTFRQMPLLHFWRSMWTRIFVTSWKPPAKRAADLRNLSASKFATSI